MERTDMIGIDFQSPIEAFQRLDGPVEADKCQAEIVKNIEALRLQCQSRSITAARLLLPPKARQRVAAIVQRIGIIRFSGKSEFATLQGFAVSAEFCQRDAAIIEHLGMTWFDRERRVIKRKRFFKPL